MASRATIEVSPPDAGRALGYQQSNPIPNKALQPDGSITLIPPLTRSDSKVPGTQSPNLAGQRAISGPNGSDFIYQNTTGRLLMVAVTSISNGGWGSMSGFSSKEQVGLLGTQKLVIYVVERDGNFIAIDVDNKLPGDIPVYESTLPVGVIAQTSGPDNTYRSITFGVPNGYYYEVLDDGYTNALCWTEWTWF